MKNTSVIRLSVAPLGMINCYLIKGQHKHILVDTGVPDSEQNIIKQLHRQQINLHDIGLIVVTHAHIDHFGSVAALKEILQVPVLVHELDAPFLRTGRSDAQTLKPTQFYWNILKRKILKDKAKPCQPDIVLTQNQEYSLNELGISGKIIHTAGHTKGSLSVLLDNGQAIVMDLLSSGIFLGGILFPKRVKHPPFHDDLTQVAQSLRMLLQTNAHTFYLGHGYAVSRKEVAYYLRHFLPQ